VRRQTYGEGALLVIGRFVGKQIAEGFWCAARLVARRLQRSLGWRLASLTVQTARVITRL